MSQEQKLHQLATNPDAAFIEEKIGYFAAFCRQGLLRNIEGRIKPEITGEAKEREMVKEAVEDFGVFLQIIDGLEKNVGSTQFHEDRGKIILSGEITKNMKVMIPEIEGVLAFLKKQKLTSEQKSIMSDVEQAMIPFKIYSVSE